MRETWRRLQQTPARTHRSLDGLLFAIVTRLVLAPRPALPAQRINPPRGPQSAFPLPGDRGFGLGAGALSLPTCLKPGSEFTALGVLAHGPLSIPAAGANPLPPRTAGSPLSLLNTAPAIGLPGWTRYPYPPTDAIKPTGLSFSGEA